MTRSSGPHPVHFPPYCWCLLDSFPSVSASLHSQHICVRVHLFPFLSDSPNSLHGLSLVMSQAQPSCISISFLWLPSNDVVLRVNYGDDPCPPCALKTTVRAFTDTLLLQTWVRVLKALTEICTCLCSETKNWTRDS